LTAQSRVADISKDVETRLSEIFNKWLLMRQRTLPHTRVTSDIQMFEELPDLHSVQGQLKEPDFIQAFLHSLHRQNLESYEIVGTVTDHAPSMIGSKMM
jgi:hypothetical protein